MTSKELREQAAQQARQIREMADKAAAEGREFNGEEQANWEKLNKDYDSLVKRAEIAARSEAVGAEMAKPAGNPVVGREPVRRDGDPALDRGVRVDTRVADEEDRATALRAWMRHQAGLSVSDEEYDACKRSKVSLSARDLEIKLLRKAPRTAAECRDLSAALGSTGGYTVPEGFVNSLERAMLAFGGVRQVASIIRTASGNDMPWPTTNDTSNTGALIGENTTVSEADPSFGQVIFRAYKYTSKLVQVPVELLQDSAVNLAVVLGEMLGERLGRITNTHFTTGDGSAKPNGIVTAASAGNTTASGTVITFDEVIDLIHRVDPAYRSAPGVGFMFNDSTLAHIRKKKDSTGQYLWQPSTQAGIPDRIWGYPYTINQDMASITSGAKAMIFGDLSKYKIRDVGDIRLRRLVERYADSDQEGFVAFMRTDGNLLNAGVAPVKYLLQA